jgi:hypothetical protein
MSSDWQISGTMASFEQSRPSGLIRGPGSLQAIKLEKR